MLLWASLAFLYELYCYSFARITSVSAFACTRFVSAPVTDALCLSQAQMELPQAKGHRRVEQNQNSQSRLWDLGFASTLKTSREKPLPDPSNHRGKEKQLSARCKLITNILILRNE